MSSPSYHVKPDSAGQTTQAVPRSTKTTYNQAKKKNLIFTAIGFALFTTLLAF